MATMVITVIKMSSHTYDDVVKLDEVLDIIKMEYIPSTEMVK